MALVLEGPFKLHQPKGSPDDQTPVAVELIPDGDPTDLAPALSLLLSSILHAHLRSDGLLELQLSDGRRVSMHAEESFCSWRLTSGNETVMMSMPENYAGARKDRLR